MLADILPNIDKMGLSICYGNYAEFQRFISHIESITGHKLKSYPSGVYEYFPYAIYFEPPAFNKRMSGLIHLCPTQASLDLIQAWLRSFFKNSYYCKGIIALSLLELAYDIPIIHKNYELLSRLAYRIVPKYGQNLYSTMCRSDNEKMCQDGAINGLITHYIQSTTSENSYLSSESLDRNYSATKHCKLYIKEIPPDIFLRIELTLRKSTLNAKFPIDKSNLDDIFAQSQNYPLPYFCSFKQVEYCKFMRNLHKHDPTHKLDQRMWKNRITEAEHMPSADRIRIMKAAAKAIKTKNLNIHRYTENLTMAEAANLPLPEGWHVSDRSPDAEIRGERARKQIKIGKPTEIAENGPYLARSGKKSENPGGNMDNSKNAPSEAQEAEMRRTK